MDVLFRNQQMADINSIYVVLLYFLSTILSNFSIVIDRITKVPGSRKYVLMSSILVINVFYWVIMYD